MIEKRSLGTILESISDTHRFNKKKLVFLNTSDILKGKILHSNYMLVNELKGQAKKTIKLDDILFSEIRPKNKRYAYIDFDKTEDFVVSTKLMVLRNISKDVETKYIYYFLTYKGVLDYLQMIAENRIASFPQITFDIVKKLKINVPKKSKQKEIIKIISSFDKKIEINNLQIKNLNNFSNKIFQYWFLQYNFPNSSNNSYQSCGGEMTKHQKIKYKFPKNWQVKKLKDLIKNESTGDWGMDQKKDKYTKKVICIRGADLNGINGDEELNAPQRYILDSNEEKILSNNDLLIEISGGSANQSTGRISIITKHLQKRINQNLICSNFCKYIQLKDQSYSYFFYYLWKKLYDNDVFFSFEGKTTGIKNLLFETFAKNYFIAIPDKSIIDKFNKMIDSFEYKKQNLLIENEYLIKLRNLIFSQLYNVN